MPERARVPAMNLSGWLGVNEMPWSPSVTYDLIRTRKLETVRLTTRGTNNRGIRLVSQRSVDKFLSVLAQQQEEDPMEAEYRLITAEAPKCKPQAEGISVDVDLEPA